MFLLASLSPTILIYSGVEPGGIERQEGSKSKVPALVFWELGGYVPKGVIFGRSHYLRCVGEQFGPTW